MKQCSYNKGQPQAICFARCEPTVFTFDRANCLDSALPPAACLFRLGITRVRPYVLERILLPPSRRDATPPRGPAHGSIDTHETRADRRGASCLEDFNLSEQQHVRIMCLGRVLVLQRRVLTRFIASQTTSQRAFRTLDYACGEVGCVSDCK